MSSKDRYAQVAFVQRVGAAVIQQMRGEKRDVKHAAIVFRHRFQRQYRIMFNTVPEGLPRHLLRTLAGEQYVNRYAIE